MDPLSEVLSLLKPASYGFRGLDAGRDWALAFPSGEGLKCFAILEGECRVSVESAPAVRLGPGDVVLLPTGKAVHLSGAADVAPVDAMALFLSVPPGESVMLNGGGDCWGFGGYFGFGGANASLLLARLPAIVHITGEGDRSALRFAMERLMRELREPAPGSALLAEHLAQALLIEALRHHLADPSADGRGWLFALSDTRLHAAITALHGDPARRWTLEALAREAGMSRSSFAASFRETVGEPAMEYLTRWRMVIAADRLAGGRLSIAEVAPSVGYLSESAFGATFKRVIGRPPRQYVRDAGANAQFVSNSNRPTSAEGPPG
ncbi:AraC family transcriptional regulator [Brevundimonas sp.]|uniref:AraC family transcriptional regulator n=1 Tax=Brevundimonas sp. TaxID=1871086 RepID=UPI003565F9A3